jgi:hypothetical protein
MDLFIAICCDRHIDETVRVFSTKEKAVEYCKEFAADEELEEQELTQSMINSGWLYYATYSCEGDNVRVEKGTLDPQE